MKTNFTRIELTMVVAMVAMLAALVAPALAKGHAGSAQAICRNNHRQLARACALYALNFNDRLPNNYTIPETENSITTAAFDNWADNVMTWDVNGIDGISTTNVAWALKGLLTPYLGTNVSVYKCPEDVYLSAVQRSHGWPARLRSVSMNGLVGRSDKNPMTATGRAWFDSNYRQFLKTSDIRQPAMNWLTIDEHADSINEGYFITSATATSWGDLPGSYHNGACVFSFADGHAEVHKWLSATSRYPVRFVYSNIRVFDAAGRKDFQWYKERIQLILYR